MSEVLRVDAEKLQAAVAAIMEKEGVAPQDAAIVADSLVSAELTGLQSHGVQRVKFYTDSMEAGGTDPKCRIKTIRDFPGGALLDAQGALGIVAAYRAMELAIQKAKDVGIGIVNVRNSNHCSCTAYYIRMAAKENMLAIVSSNAPKSMAPWGSREKYLGTNPLAVGAPTHGDPVMIDMATSVVARGKIILADKKGDSIPEGWAIDVDGHPTTDAAKALEGCVLPFGGAKGSGIAMMIDVFSGVLSGCGKTTLLNIIGGLDRYSDGDLLINGVSTKTYRDKDWDTYRNHSIGFVFQSYNLIPHLTILENVELSMTLGGVPKADRRKRAKEALIRVGLKEKLNKKPNQLSGGQMQRALLARAVISDPKLLILDEPANFVDNKFEKELYRTLHELNARMAIVMVSHDIGTITSVVKEIVCVNRQVHRHRSNILTEEQLRNYDCPIQLVSHGHIPHTVLEHHPGDCCRDHE